MPDSKSAKEAPPAKGSDEELSVEEALSWNGERLDDIGGSTIGRVDGLFVDSEDGRPQWLAVRMGTFGHHTAVPAQHAAGAAGRVWVPYERDAIRRAPKVEVDGALTKARELELLRHYEIEGPVGRAKELAKRAEDDATARPAQAE